MSQSRRSFLTHSTLAVLGAATLAADGQTPVPPQPQAGSPSAFGTSVGVGPAISADDLAHAEKLVQVQLSAAERTEAAGNWRNSMGALLERRTGPRKVVLADGDVPATQWRPLGSPRSADREAVAEAAPIFSDVKAPLPQDDAAIAYAPVTHLSNWIQSRQLTSERLTGIYLARLKRYDPQLRCVITLTETHALEAARAADREIAAGHYRGMLHGIPYGVKDLLDTADIATTWGAEPFRSRVPLKDSAVVKKLNDAGAVLVAKLSLGALALNDVWFGGQTMNPWNVDEGSSGSSAGPGAAVAAGLVAFAIGSETQGSIISPSMRCGVTGLRPTFGRVARSGAMTLSWTCDKLGPMTRSVEDALLVLSFIGGADAGDLASVDQPLVFDASNAAAAGADVKRMRVGYFPAWMKEATDVDRHALDVVKSLGMETVEVSLPDWPYDSLNVILFAEAAAAFEEITLDHRVDQLKMQVPDAWPNSFRQARFLSAVDLVQADRLRRKVALEMERLMREVDVLLVPSLRDEMMVISNFTGHPSLTLRAGFVEITEARTDWAPGSMPVKKYAQPRRVPHGVTLIGRLFGEGRIAEVGMTLERAFDVSGQRPPLFA